MQLLYSDHVTIVQPIKHFLAKLCFKMRTFVTKIIIMQLLYNCYTIPQLVLQLILQHLANQNDSSL